MKVKVIWVGFSKYTLFIFMFACFVDWIEGSESVQVESSCTYSKDQLNNQEAIPSAWGGSGMFTVKQL